MQISKGKLIVLFMGVFIFIALASMLGTTPTSNQSSNAPQFDKGNIDMSVANPIPKRNLRLTISDEAQLKTGADVNGLWVLRGTSFIRYDGSGNILRSNTIPAPADMWTTSRNGRALVVYSSFSNWIAYDTGGSPVFSGACPQPMACVAIDNNGNIAGCSRTTANLFHVNSGGSVVMTSGLPSIANCVVMARVNVIAVSSNAGGGPISKFTFGNGAPFIQKGVIGTPKALAISTDGAGTWVATTSDYIHHVEASYNINSYTVDSISTNDNGQYCLGQGGTRLYIFEVGRPVRSNSSSYTYRSSKISPASAYCIASTDKFVSCFTIGSSSLDTRWCTQYGYTREIQLSTAISADGNNVWAGGNKGTLYSYNPVGSIIWTKNPPLIKAQVKVVSDTNYAWIMHGTNLTLYNSNGVKQASTIIAGTVDYWTVSRNGRALVVYNAMSRWIAFTSAGGTAFDVVCPSGQQMGCAAIDDSGNVAGGSRSTTTLFHVNPAGTPITSSALPAGLANCVAMSRGGVIAVGMAGGAFAKYNYGNPAPVYGPAGVSGPGKAVTISADGTTSWLTTTANVIHQVENGYSVSYKLDGISTSDNGQRCMGYSAQSLYVFERTQAVRSNISSNAYYSMMISGDGNYGVATTDRFISFFSTSSAAPSLPCLWAFWYPSSDEMHSSSAISSDGNYIWGGTEDGKVYQYDFLDTDLDMLSDGYETYITGTYPTIADSDNDGASDGYEVITSGTDPLNPDCDHDGALDGYEIFTSLTNPLNPDTDGDGLSDGWEIYNSHTNPKLADTDGDGLNDGVEIFTYHTDPIKADTDGDGMPDGWEVNNNLNPLNPSDGTQDPDNDGLINKNEYNRGCNPHNPDTDGDGLSDGWEVDHGLDPTKVDTDGDTMPDGWEVQHGTNPLVNDAAQDPDGDGLVNVDEYSHSCDPHSYDSDGDGLSDGNEVHVLGTNPTNRDTDGDRMPDGWEVNNGLNPLVNDASDDPDLDNLCNFDEYNWGTDPHNRDTDGDSFIDGNEVLYYWDPLDPSVPISHPSDMAYEFRSIGNQIEWRITEWYGTWDATNYTIYRNGTDILEGTWTPISAVIDVAIDGLPLGSYNFTIVAFGVSVSMTVKFNDTVIVNVTNFPPSISSPADIEYEYSTTGNVISWTITDHYNSTTSYHVLLDSIEVDSGTWITGWTIGENIDGLATGTYNYTIIAADGLGGVSQDTVFVTVSNFLPVLNPYPSDVTYEYTTTGHEISWNATDNSIGTTSFVFYIDSVVMDSGTWVSGMPYVVNIDGLAIGTYEYAITFNDGLGGSIWVPVMVTVANFNPALNPDPSDVLYEYATTGHEISWNATDNSIGTTSFVFYIDSVVKDSGTWVSGMPYVVDIDGLAIGTYNYTIFLDDGMGGALWDTVMITVENFNPVLNPDPSDVLYEYSTTGHEISWNATDNSIGTTAFVFYIDSVVMDSGTWVSNVPYVVDIDGLAIGTYNYTIFLDDGMGGALWDTVIVSVINVDPTINNPLDITYAHNTAGHSISWIVSDNSLSGTSYTIYCNGAPVDSGSWTPGVSIDIDVDGLDVGNYNYTIVAMDGLGGSVEDEVDVTVLNVAPGIDHPVDITYGHATSGHGIAWTVIDPSIALTSYFVYRNNSQVATGTWTSGIAIDIAIDGLAIGTYNYTIVAIDGLGGSVQDMVLVFVINVAPVITNPVDIAYIFGTTGNVISWTIIDADTGITTYSIYRNAILITGGSWISNTAIIDNADGLAVGFFNFTIIASDGLGGSVQDEVDVTVLNVAPVITTPVDITYNHGTTGHTISWTITDASTGTTSHVVKQDSTIVASGSWATGIPVVESVDGLAVGTYNFTIIASDGLGGSVQDEVDVTVLNVAPAISSPANIIYSHGSTGHAISWTITDASTGTTSYVVKQDGTIVASGSWAAGIPVVASVDGLAVGFYNFTIIASDGLGGSVQDEVDVTVLNVAPAISSPANIIYSHGSTGHAISWTITDASIGTTSHFVKQDGTIVASGSWATGIPVVENVDGLAVGIYNFTIIASDGLGGSVQDEVDVTVLNIAPAITTPFDITYNHGSTGHAISWTITDASTGTTSYTVQQNGSVVASGAWTSSIPVVVNVDGLSVGIFGFTITASDGLGGSVQDSVIVTVRNIIPSITTPVDITYNHGSTGHIISWTISDVSTGTTSYIILRNGAPVILGTWITSVPVLFNVDGLFVGFYNFTIIASDGLGGSVQDEVDVTVLNVAPTISSPANIIYNHGATGHAISWTITDASTGTTSHVMKQDSTIVASGSWATGIPVVASVDGLAVGTYNFTIIASDGLGGSVQDEVDVTVLNVAPAISSPANIIYNHGSTGHTISWTITDASTGTTNYVVKQDGSNIASGSWATGIPVLENIDGLAVGIYNFTIIASDGLGGSVQDEVDVTVLNVAPAISNPANIIYSHGSTGHSISWVITDASTGTTSHVVKQDGSVVASGSWVTGIPVVRNVDGLAVGTYNFTIITSDGLGGSAQDEVDVTVINVAPTITSPADISYNHGTTGHAIPWTITDASTGTTNYVVRKDGAAFALDSWISAVPLSINVDGLMVGNYNFTIIANDGLGLTVRDTVFVTVLNNIPTITNPADINYVYNTIGHKITWVVTDASTGTTIYNLLQNGSILESHSWYSGNPISYDVDGLPSGSYNYTILAIDGLSGSVQDEVDVTVTCMTNTPPTITSPSDVSYYYGSSGNTVTWTITDSSTNTTSYILRRDGSPIAIDSWVSGSPVVIVVDGRPVGSYSYQITALDGFGGSVQDTVIVTVLNVMPAITGPADISYGYGSTGHSIIWTITDASTAGTNYDIKQDGTIIKNGLWASGIPIEIGVDGFALGLYNFTIIASDGLGGSVQDEVDVTVLNVAPTITTPVDISYGYGTGEHAISWTITDSSTSTANYIMQRNGSVIGSNTWSTGVPVVIDIDALAVGFYNYTIVANDGLGGSVQDMVLVTVLSNPIVITHPSDITCASGTLGNFVSWTVTEAYVGTTRYEIFRNGSRISSGSWSSGIPINATLDYLAPGNYNLTIVVNNGFGITISDEVAVAVIQDIIPVAVFSVSANVIKPGDYVNFTHVGSEGDAPVTYQWSFGDGTPNSTSANPSHQYKDLGTYTAKLSIIDADGDIAIYSIIITVANLGGTAAEDTSQNQQIERIIIASIITAGLVVVLAMVLHSARTEIKAAKKSRKGRNPVVESKEIDSKKGSTPNGLTPQKSEIKYQDAGSATIEGGDADKAEAINKTVAGVSQPISESKIKLRIKELESKLEENEQFLKDKYIKKKEYQEMAQKIHREIDELKSQLSKK